MPSILEVSRASGEKRCGALSCDYAAKSSTRSVHFLYSSGFFPLSKTFPFFNFIGCLRHAATFEGSAQTDVRLLNPSIAER